jgi:hypothetical protein
VDDFAGRVKAKCVEFAPHLESEIRKL